jgi:hypothetical protein
MSRRVVHIYLIFPHLNGDYFLHGKYGLEESGMVVLEYSKRYGADHVVSQVDTPVSAHYLDPLLQ